ncbi:MAG TPA: winged helix-turn-helix domain-containing protein [Pyrinomonadaceae bacterium]|jgi:serine/threonine-protein kinase
MDEPKSHIYEFGDFRVNAAKRLLLKRDGKQVPLTPKVFETLLYLVQHDGKIVDKEDLMSAIWVDTIVEENNLSQNISILRRALGEKRGEHRFIATVPGRGFRFVADVHKIEEDEKERKREREGKTESPENLPSRKEIHNSRIWIAAIVAIAAIGFGIATFNVWRTKTVSVSPIKTVAVLPFKPLVAENRDEALEMGMADTLISRLGNNREIVVRPLSSVRRYGDLEQDAVAAGRTLNVDSVLDGTIQRWGDKIRVTVRLVKVADGDSLWTGTFDENFTDIFVVQDTISNKVASALALKLSGEEQIKFEKRATNSAEAYENYSRGRYHYFKLTAPGILQAIVFYQRAIEIDSNYALAYAAMADAYRTLAITTYARSKEVCPQAKSLALRALEIDGSLAEAHLAAGNVKFLCDWDWSDAERELKKAIELSPNNSDAHRSFAHVLSNVGRHDEAVAEGRHARELDPLTLVTNSLEGQFLLYAGRDDEAILRLNKTLELEPNFWHAHAVLGRVYTYQKRYAEAVAELTKAREFSGGGTEPATQLGYALARAGRRGEAEAVLAELKSFSIENYVPAYNFAMIYNGLNERAECLNYLEKSFQEREVQMTFVKVDSRWDSLRTEPRFIEIIKQMNFE